MSLTLLLDLDETLLVNPMGKFVPAYLQAISKHLAPYVDPALTSRALLAGTQRMIENERPDCTLKNVFDETFYPAIGVQQHDMQASIDQFYRQVYPSLQPLTHPVPGAVEVVRQAFERGYRIAIATNPLFPRTAIVQRIAWAGLPLEEYPFALVPSYESFHFAKPHPAYLAELLARLGWPGGPVVMVGDDLENDMLSARGLGIAYYRILPDGDQVASAENGAQAAGPITNLLDWLDTASPSSLQPNFTQVEAILAVLRSTPAALTTLCQEVLVGQWSQRPNPAEWCQTEIICHLRDVETEVHLSRIDEVLKSVNPFIAGMDTDPWAEQRNYIEQNGPQALHQFTLKRLQTLARLEKLAPEDWERTARHAILGPTNLHELVRIMADHDRLHIQQAYSTLRAYSKS